MNLLTLLDMAATGNGDRQRRPFIIADGVPSLLGGAAAGSSAIREWEDLVADPACGAGVPDAVEPDPDDEAVLRMTSGTTAEPRSAVLRHRHLVSYILGSVEFGAADSGDAVIVSVPPYHIAAVANLLSNLYTGRLAPDPLDSTLTEIVDAAEHSIGVLGQVAVIGASRRNYRCLLTDNPVAPLPDSVS